MQIQGNYNSYSSTGYEHKHNHHITNCLHEGQEKQLKDAAGGIMKDTFSGEKFSGDSGREDAKPEVTFTHTNPQKNISGEKKITSFLKGIWDAMGNEGVKENQGIFSPDNERIDERNIDVSSSAVKQIFPYKIFSSLGNNREKLRVGISNTLKHFGRGGASFGALTNSGERFAGKRGDSKSLEESRKKGTRQKDGDIPTAFLQDSHLMDSYSKTGAYCRLNENLTYQKIKTLPQSEKQPVKGE